ncbi:MAG TPA: family 43 glycosylhydrolase, partial [Ginsengibacter sp.]
MNKVIIFFYIVLFNGLTLYAQTKTTSQKSGNPLFPGWYADPEAALFNNTYWIYPTYSASYDKQVFFDAFSSSDLVNWIKHRDITDTSKIKWAHRAMWAPAIVEKDKKYY